jgi:cysteine desulfurase
MAADVKTIYFDNNATTRVAPEVFEAMVPYLTEHYGNPSSAYHLAQASRQAVTVSREKVASLLQADPKEIIFTSCGTESDNMALWSALHTTGKKHLVTTQVEHSAIHNFGERLERQGFAVTWLPVDADGLVDPNQVEEVIRPDTALVSVMWANNETGVLSPIERIGEICRAKKVLFHTDAVQVPGKVKIDLSQLPVDLLSLAGHKFHAPKGVGVLYARRGVKVLPYVLGGGQEGGRRGGTENVASIVGLGRAAELAQETLIDEQTSVREWRDRLETGLLQRIPDAVVNGHKTLRLPNTLNIRFAGLEAEAVLLKLDQHGVCVSSGSACTTGSVEPSHVLTAMGLSPEQAKGAVRLSLSHYNTSEEVDRVLDLLPRVIAELRAQMPVAR